MSSKLKQQSITGRRYPAPILLRIKRLACSLRTGSWGTSRNKKPRMVKLLRNAIFRGNGVISGLSAPAESVNGLYKTEVIDYLKQDWEGEMNVALATLNWIHWYNHERLHFTNGYLLPERGLAKHRFARVQENLPSKF